MNRVWTALLLLATLVVAAAVVYVLVHDDPVPEAGKTPAYSASPLTNAPTTNATSTRTSQPTTRTSDPVQSSGPSSSGTTTPSGRATIAFLGDNWTVGAGASATSKRFVDLLAGALDAKAVVVAKAGTGYAKAGPDGQNYVDLVANVVAADPDIVVVSGGRNDASDDPSTLHDAAAKVFADLSDKLPGATIVAVAPFWGDSDHPADLTKVDKAVKDGITKADGTFLDLADPLHGHADWMADEANPNDRGNQAIADALKPKLAPLLGG